MDCTFCRLLRDDAARWVTRGPVVSAFAPLDPLAPGHTLVIPTSHWTDIFDAPPEVSVHAMTLVQLLAGKMRSELKADGVNILSASGPGSEQSVPHLHFHVVPRWSDDTFTTWPTQQWNSGVVEGHVNRIRMLNARCSAVQASSSSASESCFTHDTRAQLWLVSTIASACDPEP